MLLYSVGGFATTLRYRVAPRALVTPPLQVIPWPMDNASRLVK